MCLETGSVTKLFMTTTFSSAVLYWVLDCILRSWALKNPDVCERQGQKEGKGCALCIFRTTLFLCYFQLSDLLLGTEVSSAFVLTPLSIGLEFSQCELGIPHFKHNCERDLVDERRRYQTPLQPLNQLPLAW